MLVFQRLGLPRRMAWLAGAFGMSVLGASIAPAAARPPRYPDILPLSQVKPGMVGYGLTTFHGVTISRFQVRVVGILKKENAGHDLILIRMKGGPITERGANLIQGMSGSPIYLNGKVAGAFSMGEQFPKEPVGMVTPIEDMLEAWDPDIPQQPTYFEPAEKPAAGSKISNGTSGIWHSDNRTRVVVLPHPLDVGGRRLTELVLNARPNDLRASTGNRAVLHPATTLLAVSGISERDRVWFQKELDKRGYALTVAEGPGIGAAGRFKGAPLRPGSAFGTFLASGDIEIGATGTVTYRRGNRLLGFGHPLMGLGAIEAAITSASIVDIFSGIRISHHIAVAGPVVGALVQDRDFSVSAEIGRSPRLIPFDITVHDETTGRSRVFSDYVLQHPDLTPLLLRIVAHEAVTEVHDVPGDVMARVTTTVEAAEVGKITRTNVVFDADDIAGPAIQDLGEITGIVSGNPFYPLPVNRVRLTVDITNGHNAASLDRIFLKQGRYEPGDTVDVGVVLKPYRRNPITRTLSIKIPSDTPSGRYQLIVRGGDMAALRMGSILFGGGQFDSQAPPVNVQQMVTRLNEREKNTDIVGRLLLNTTAPALEGEKLSQLPPNLSALMRSDRNSGVRLERDEARSRISTEYVVSGIQQLLVSVVRKNMQEAGPQSSYNGQPVPQTPPGVPPFFQNGNTTGVSLGGDGADPGDAAATLNGATAQPAATDEPGSWTLHDAGSEPIPTTDGAPPAPRTARKSKQSRSKESQAPVGAPLVKAAPIGDGAPLVGQQPDNAAEKPVGRQLQTWRQTAGHDFATGKFDGTSVTAAGELRLAPTLRRFASTTEPFIWAVEPDGHGNLFAGTGTSGKVLKVDATGNVTTFATLPIVSVQSLLRAKDGTLWAGSAVKGSVFRISPTGEVTLVCSLPDKYILAMAEDSRGNLFLGPGGGGTVYRLTRAQRDAGKEVTPDAYLKTPAEHIMSLHVDAHDNLFVGTGNNGLVYQVSPDGKSHVLYDAKENAVTALATDPQGNLYFGTGPKAVLYRISADGVASVIYDRATTFFTAIKRAPDGSFYASTVNALYHILPGLQPDGSQAAVQPFDNPKDVDILNLAILADGNVAATTGNVGEIYISACEGAAKADRAGTYESVVHDAKVISRWGTARWDAIVPTGAHLVVETRAGNASDPDATWSAWTATRASSGAAEEGAIVSPPARFIQYRVRLETSGSGAGRPVSLRELSVSYMTRNQPPKVTLAAPVGGERWARAQTIRWNGSDPDNDALSYEVLLSADSGMTWKKLPTTAEGGAPAGGADSPGTAAPQFPKKASENLRQAIMDGIRKESSAGGAAGSGQIRGTSKQWDTKSVPDGVYMVKVIASDRASNPTDALTAEALSDPFIIANASPVISLAPVAAPAADGSVTVHGAVVQSLIAIVGVQYRVDDGDWIAAIPQDGLFDSSRERFTFTTAPLTKGSHNIEVAAFNAAGSKAVEKLPANIP